MQNQTLQFAAINKAVFLNFSHRFDEDHAFGEIMRRFRMGKVTTEDINQINTRFIQNEDVSLPIITELRCARYMNTERNAYNNVVSIEHKKKTNKKTHRKIKHILGANHHDKVGRLLCNELYTVGQGGWSGFPPHKHDTDRLPKETRHDETYNYRFKPNNGFGFH